MPSTPAARRATRDAWDDEAWAATSDDDEFVARATQSTKAAGPAYAARPWPGMPTMSRTRSNADVPITADEADYETISFAERRMSMASPVLEAEHGRLEAIVEDPMHLLTRSKALTYTLSRTPSRPATPQSDVPAVPALPTQDVAQSSLSAWIGAAAFDPLATMSDGVFTTPAAPEPPLEPGIVPGAALPPPPPPPSTEPPRLERRISTRTLRNREKLVQCLQCDTIDLSVLRSLAWKGVPADLRPVVWPILLGYLPSTAAIRTATLARKRAEYASGVERAFRHGTESLDRAAWHQIQIDVPRTNPGLRLWQQAETQRALERILYVWAIRHPASGYVQGINDLVTPFFEVFLSAYIDSDPETFEFVSLPRFVRDALEADTFWCMSRLLDGIQDNYIFAQPGILRQLSIMSDVVKRMDAPLHAHLAEQGVEYMQFSFRWMNCLLMREMSVKSIIRIWDTYLAEGADSFADFHPFVCAVFLHRWRAELLTMDFQGIIMFLQSLPTQHWSDKDAEMLLSEAFMYKSLFGNSAHIGA